MTSRSILQVNYSLEREPSGGLVGTRTPREYTCLSLPPYICPQPESNSHCLLVRPKKRKKNTPNNNRRCKSNNFSNSTIKIFRRIQENLHPCILYLYLHPLRREDTVTGMSFVHRPSPLYNEEIDMCTRRKRPGKRSIGVKS